MIKLKKNSLDKSKLSLKKLSDVVSFGATQKYDKKELLASTDQIGLDNHRSQQDNRKLIVYHLYLFNE